MDKVKVYNRFNRPPSKPMEFNPDENRTRQEFAAECDIHNILKKFKLTGVLVDPTVGNLRRPMFEDFTNLPTLEQFEDLKKSINDSFYSLPKEIQARFGDPLIAANFFGRANNSQILQLWRECGLDSKSSQPSQPTSQLNTQLNTQSTTQSTTQPTSQQATDD